MSIKSIAQGVWTNAIYDAFKELMKLMAPLLTASVFQYMQVHKAEVWGIAFVVAIVIALFEKIKPRPHLDVDSARWVCTIEPNKFIDVKGVIEGSIINGTSIKLQASDQLLGDPCPGHPKRLEVILASRETIIVPHGGWLKR